MASTTCTTYDAIADPTRRSVLRLLAERELTAGELAAAFIISRPAVSRHLRVLREAGLASIRAFWEPRLDALERHLDERSPRT